jgi:hypothetical protein
MDLMQTPLGDEVQRIINSKQGKPNAYTDAVIHTKFGDVAVMRVLNYDNVRDYVSQYSDEITLVVVVPAGQMAYRIAPSRNELEITITGASVSRHGREGNESQGLGSQRFRAVLKKSGDATLEANSRELLDERTMDIQNIDVIEFQLFSKAMEQFSMRSCGNIYRKTAVGDLVRSLLMQEMHEIEVEDEYKPRGIDMVDPVDTAVRDHIVIEHGIMAYDAPGYIHQHCGGIYSAGLSYYYQDDFWYVYPTYDYKKFEEASRQLVIIQIPENKLPSLDYTYMVEGSVVNIVATGGLILDDTSDVNKRSSGNGVRFVDASKFFEGGVEVSGNKALMSRAKQNNEFVSSKQKSGLNNIVMSSERISANNMLQSSRLASREGVRIQLTWQNADASLIRPGMQTKIYYYKNGQVRQIAAVVIGVHVSNSYEGTGLVSGRYSRNVAINLFAANEASQE